MTTLRFDAAAVRELALHAFNASQHSNVYGQEKNPGPGLILVKDEGIYLMSNGKPDLMANDPVRKERRKVVYAKGFEPNATAPGDLHDKCRDAVGGDDFAEALPLSKNMVEAIKADDFDGLILRITPNQITTIIDRKAAPPVHKRAGVTDYIARNLKASGPATGRVLFVGIKKGARKPQLWSLPIDSRIRERQIARIHADYRGAVILNDLPLAEAVEAFAKAMGWPLKD